MNIIRWYLLFYLTPAIGKYVALKTDNSLTHFPLVPVSSAQNDLQ